MVTGNEANEARHGEKVDQGIGRIEGAVRAERVQKIEGIEGRGSVRREVAVPEIATRIVNGNGLSVRSARLESGRKGPNGPKGSLEKRIAAKDAADVSECPL